MSNILNFEKYAKNQKFKETIINVLKAENPLYEFAQDDDRGIAFLHFNKYVYIFLKYIPRGEITPYPNLKDSMKGVVRKERHSTGEWVIEDIRVLEEKEAFKLFPIIYSKSKSEGWIDDFKAKVEELLLD